MSDYINTHFFICKKLGQVSNKNRLNRTFTESVERSDADFTGELDYDMISLMPIDEIIL